MSTKIKNIWRDPDGLDNLENLRDKKRIKSRGQRQTFDCFRAKPDGDKVYCSLGHQLSSNSNDGRMSLIAVLKGMTSSTCKQCPDFDGDD